MTIEEWLAYNAGYWQGFITFLGFAFTIFVIDKFRARLQERRAKRQAKKDEKKEKEPKQV